MSAKDLAHQKQESVTGLNVNYYLIDVPNPKRLEPYVAEVEDIIEALNMTFHEGNALKALVRTAKLRMNLGKPGSSPLYEAQKVKHAGDRILAMAERKKEYEQQLSV